MSRLILNLIQDTRHQAGCWIGNAMTKEITGTRVVWEIGDTHSGHPLADDEELDRVAVGGC